MNKILALKVGLNHVGFSLIERKGDDPLKIIKTGAHFFKAAENPKNKGSINQHWAEERRRRTTSRRKKWRVEDVKNILFRSFLKPYFSDLKPEKNVWEVRKKALTQKLTPHELINAIRHINKLRGYQAFSRKIIDEGDVVQGRILEALDHTKKFMNDNGIETFGAYMADKFVKRNKQGEYTNIAHRDWIEKEFLLIMERQKTFYGNDFFTEDEIEELRKKIISQRPLKSCEHLVGNCGFFPEEKNAPKSHPLVLEYSLLILLNSADFYDPETKQNYSFDSEQLLTLVSKFYETGKLGIKDIKTVFGLAKSAKIESRKKLTSTFFSKPFLLELKDILGVMSDYFFNISPELLEKLLKGVSYYFSPEEVKSYLIENVFTPENKILINFNNSLLTGGLNNLDDDFYNECIEKLSLTPSFSGTSNISLKAVKVLLPFLQKGLDFQDAVEHARFQKLFPNEKNSWNMKRLPPFEPTHNAVVNRSLAQTRKIINNIISTYGKVDAIHIESGRELGKSLAQRKKIIKNNQKLSQEKSTIKEIMSEYNIHENPESILLMRVWKYQNEIDFLTGEVITLTDIINHRAAVIPLNEGSINRSFSNMIVTLKENIPNKFTFIESIVASIEHRTEHYYLSRLKSMQKYLEQEQTYGNISSSTTQQSWVLQNLRTHLTKCMNDIDIVYSPKGVIPFLRHIWNIEYDDKPTFERVATESLLSASVSTKLIKDITEFLKTEEGGNFSIPFPYSDKEFYKALSTLQPTLAPDRSTSGEGHDYKVFKILDPSIKKLPNATRIVFPKKLERPKESVETKILKRIALKEITKANFSLIYNLKKNPDLEEKLKTRLEEFKWDAAKAFQEPLYINNLRNPGKKVPVNKIYIYDDSRCVITMRGGVANYSSMICLNIYKHEHNFCGSPIYAIDILKLKKDTIAARAKNLPLPVFPTTMIDGRSEFSIDPKAKFIGRVYYGDYIKIIKKCLIPTSDKVGSKIVEGYFNSYNRSTNALILQYWKESILDENGKLISSSVINEETTAFSIFRSFDIELCHVTILGDKSPKIMKEIPLVR